MVPFLLLKCSAPPGPAWSRPHGRRAEFANSSFCCLSSLAAVLAHRVGLGRTSFFWVVDVIRREGNICAGLRVELWAMGLRPRFPLRCPPVPLAARPLMTSTSTSTLRHGWVLLFRRELFAARARRCSEIRWVVRELLTQESRRRPPLALARPCRHLPRRLVLAPAVFALLTSWGRCASSDFFR